VINEADCLEVMPVIDMHAVLLEAGVILPPHATVFGDPRSRAGAMVDAERVTLRSGIEVVRHGHKVLLKSKDDIEGEWACNCEGGKGGCDVVSTEDDNGNPGLGCVDQGCSARCKMFVKIPDQKFNAFAIRTLGVELPPEVPTSGDITSETGCLIDAAELRMQDRYRPSFVQMADNMIALYRNNLISGTFRCSCSFVKGGCGVTISSQILVCKPRSGCKGCRMVINIPKVTLGMV